MKSFTAAGIQMAVVPNQPQANIEKALRLLEQAVAEYGAQLVVFPESVTTGFTPAMPTEAFHALLDTIPGRLTLPIQEAARKLKVHVVWPTYEAGESKSIIYNSAALITPDGEIGALYRKTHPFPTERKEGGGWTTPGSDPIVCKTELGNIGLMVCYDGDFPELARVEALAGAEIIVRPSAFLRSFEIWELTNRARAYDNHVYFIAVNAVGSDASGQFYFGHSMIVNPIARKLAQARGTEEILAAPLDPDPLRYLTYGTHSPQWFDHLEDRNLQAYQGILQPGQSAFEPSRRVPYRH